MTNSTFGKIDIGTKWDIYRGRPVSVILGNNTYAGIVSVIDPLQNYVYLQPCASINPIGTELSIIDKPIMVPFEGPIVIPTKQDTLEEFVKNWNEEKAKERNSKK